MMAHGIKASELIKMLQRQMELHGDCEVFAGGEDYPGGVNAVWYDAKGDAYHRPNCFKIGVG
jgi:hypothetical protein